MLLKSLGQGISFVTGLSMVTLLKSASARTYNDSCGDQRNVLSLAELNNQIQIIQDIQLCDNA
jgi:hypothetical protein